MGVVLEIIIHAKNSKIEYYEFMEVYTLPWREAWKEKDRLCRLYNSQGRSFTVRGRTENLCYLG